MRPGRCHVRPPALALGLAFGLALALVAPLASARDIAVCDPALGRACVSEQSDGPDCGRDAAVLDLGHQGASVSGERYCGDDGTRGNMLHASVSDGNGRTAIRWERVWGPWGDYRELQIERAPNVVDWYEDENGCATIIAIQFVHPGEDHGCVVGAPPDAPAPAWGELLP